MIPGISDRDYRCLEIIYKLRISRATDIAWLAGYSDYTYCRKRLAVMEREGLLRTERDCKGAKCYYLTEAGLAKIGKYTSRVYEVSYTTNHALAVGDVCVWLYLTRQVSIYDMLVDIDLMSLITGKVHRPDIVLGKSAYEVELNHKPMKKLLENIRSNEMYTCQVWIVPDERRNIARNLKTAAEMVGTEINIVPLSRIRECISNANIHNNQYMSPSGDARDDVRTLLQHNKNQTVIDKYLGGVSM